MFTADTGCCPYYQLNDGFMSWSIYIVFFMFLTVGEVNLVTVMFLLELGVIPLELILSNTAKHTVNLPSH